MSGISDFILLLLVLRARLTGNVPLSLAFNIQKTKHHADVQLAY